MSGSKSISAVIYKIPFKLLFYLLLLLYILVYGPYGFEDGDMGTVFSISWSMYNGLFPFTDFVYIKPPMSPYFHSLPLYISEEYAYIFNRFGYYIQVFAYSLLAVKILCKFFNLEKTNVVYFLAILCALVTIHNYPPTPWNTVDGVFFCVLGSWFLFYRKEKIYNYIIGAFFISLGVLCKQSFFFFPVFVSIFLIVQQNFKKLGWLIGSGIFFGGSFLLLLFAQNALQPFFNQLFSFTPGSSLIDTGIRSYYLPLKFNFFLFIVLLAGFLFIRKFKPNNITFTYFSLVVIGIFMYLYLQPDSFHTVKKSLLQLLFVSATAYCFFNLKNRKYQFLLLFLSLSWCASISNGFNTPIHFATPIVFTFFVWAFSDISKFKNWVGFTIISFFAITFYVGYQNVYMDSQRNELTYNMGTIYPQLTFVKSDKETFKKYAELKKLSVEYSNFTILPSVTLGHYLTETVNPIGVDWVFNHHLADQLPEYIKKLEEKNVTVFLENFENHVNNYEESSELTMYVKDNWKMVEERSHFRVFQKAE